MAPTRTTSSKYPIVVEPNEDSGGTPATSNSSLPTLSNSQADCIAMQTRPQDAEASARNPVETETPSQERIAELIKQLYDRLEVQGVTGDGWEEGRERSRDGRICRPDAWSPEDTNERPGVNGLAEKQEHLLKRMDRYGFFSTSHPASMSQHSRTAHLPSAPFEQLVGSKAKPASSKSAKSAVNGDPRSSTMTHLAPVDLKLESKRITKWGDMLTVGTRDSGGNISNWQVADHWWQGRQNGSGQYRRFQRRAFKGIPDRWRRAVWDLEIEKMASERAAAGEKVPSIEALDSLYHKLIKQPSLQDIQIDLDVPRTISGHVLFHTRYGSGQRALFLVLHAVGIYCQDIGGYCQGMGPIAATFLCYFEPVRVFTCMVRLIDQYRLKHIFAPGFPGLLQAFYVQERLVDEIMPEVHASFSTNMISTSAYATSWYITLFSNSVSFGTQARLWDAFLLEGIDVLIVTSVAIIWCFRDQFTAQNATFETILSLLSSSFILESDDAFLRWIRKTLNHKGIREKMKTWNAEWEGYVQDGSASKRVT